MSQEEEIILFYLGFGGYFGESGRKPILCEIIEEHEKTLKVRLRESVPPYHFPKIFANYEKDLPPPPEEGQEYIINRRHRRNKDILEILQSGGVVAYYVDKLNPSGHKLPGTFLFPYNHPSIERKGRD